jgi:ribosomal 30S subunit maturation factor RimM
MTFEHDPVHAPNASEHVPAPLTGRTVLDSQSVKVGKVTDVLFHEGNPDWAVVKTGALGGEHFVPLEHTYVDVDGRLVVPFNKTEIKRAPRPTRDHVITSQARNQLRDYYGLAA